jgi:GNAT superfamily N-acetyltransferase
MAEINLYHPAQLDSDEWRQLQGIERDAYAATLDQHVVSQDDIDALVSWDNPERFRTSHVDPNTEVGKHFNFNQIYAHPRVAVATEHGEPVGFAFAAHNVSYGPPGGPQDDSAKAQAIRYAKLGSAVLPPPRNKSHFAIREVALAPDHLRQGVGTQLARTILRRAAIPLQPVTAYTWPDIDPDWIQPILEQHGFAVTGIRPARIFGEGSEPVRQARMQATTVRGVLRSMQYERR